jgi:type III restriction enzyme
MKRKPPWKPTGCLSNNNGQYGRWAFAEFTDAYQIQSDFEAKVETEFNKMIESVSVQPVA